MGEDKKRQTRVLVTGASGFIGRELIESLSVFHFYHVSCLLRRKIDVPHVQQILIQDLELIAETDYLFDNIDVVIHLAAIAHTNTRSEQEFYRVNACATSHLASIAAKAGVKRFIFLSSIGVNGTFSNVPFTSLSEPVPTEAYARSKLDAEIQLQDLANRSEMEVVIIRPPLVYGKNAPGNFGKLVSLVESGIPLPFGSVNAKRSFLAVDNLINFIELCINHPKAANKIFLVSDDEDVTLPELLFEIGQAKRKKIFLFPVPVVFLKLAGILIGRYALVERLCGQLQVDITFSKETLGWRPIVGFRDGIRKCFVTIEKI